MEKWSPLIKEVLKTSGPAAIIAFILVWFLMGSVTRGIAEVHNQLNGVSNQINNAQIKMDAFAARQQEIDLKKIQQNDRMLEIMRSICFSVADAPSVRAGCAK